MNAIKHGYVRFAHASAKNGLINSLSEKAKTASAYGWHRWLASLSAIYDTERMVDLDLPWWNVAATVEVENFLKQRSGPTVFETGAGASTAWLARRAAKVISIEHDKEWHHRFTAMIGDTSNVDLRFRSLGDASANSDYVAAIDESTEQYDMIVVDGRARVNCLNRAIPHLKPGGIILFDDSGRSRYRTGIEGCGLKEKRYFGRSFCVPYPDYTSILTID